MPSEDNKRIAKNTLFLYFRMMLTMSISLYTSRIVLNTLGVKDFGIYNVVGGVVVLFSFLNNAMSIATQRFISFELGKNNIDETKRVFGMSMTIHICIVMFIILLAETGGLWFLNTQMNFPAERMKAVNWVYQFSLITTCIGIIQVPYYASIIAHEKMSFYAYIGMGEAIFKLLIAFILTHTSYDKLKLYSILTCLIAFCIFSFYKYYCNKKIQTSIYHFFWDQNLFKKILSFSGWSLTGGIVTVGATQGVNVLLNIFNGVVVNAAMGISNQVNGAIYGFVANFQSAFNPQIVKLYAVKKKEELERLICRAAKFSFLLLFLLAFPIILNIDFVLYIWLKKNVPYASTFCILIIFFSFIEALAAPLWTAIQATGNIKKYQLVLAPAIGLNVLLSYIFLKMKYSPEIVLEIKVLVNILCLGIRLYFIKNIINLYVFFREVLLRILYILILTLPLIFIFHYYEDGWKKLIISTVSFCFLMIFLIYFIGLNKMEKIFINKSLTKYLINKKQE